MAVWVVSMLIAAIPFVILRLSCSLTTDGLQRNLGLSRVFGTFVLGGPYCHVCFCLICWLAGRGYS
jgi:hypothetical protein